MMIRTIQAQCDVCGTVSDLTDPSSTDLKKALRQEGWRFRNGHHRCTRCATEPLATANVVDI